MNNKNDSTKFTLERTAAVLIRSFWIGAGIGVIWAVLYFAGAPGMQQQFLGLTHNELKLVWVAWMGAWKLFTLACLVPYFAIRIVLAGQSSAETSRLDTSTSTAA